MNCLSTHVSTVLLSQTEAAQKDKSGCMGLSLSFLSCGPETLWRQDSLESPRRSRQGMARPENVAKKEVLSSRWERVRKIMQGKEWPQRHSKSSVGLARQGRGEWARQ